MKDINFLIVGMIISQKKICRLERRIPGNKLQMPSNKNRFFRPPGSIHDHNSLQFQPQLIYLCLCLFHICEYFSIPWHSRSFQVGVWFHPHCSWPRLNASSCNLHAGAPFTFTCVRWLYLWAHDTLYPPAIICSPIVI